MHTDDDEIAKTLKLNYELILEFFGLMVFSTISSMDRHFIQCATSHTACSGSTLSSFLILFFYLKATYVAPDQTAGIKAISKGIVRTIACVHCYIVFMDLKHSSMHSVNMTRIRTELSKLQSLQTCSDQRAWVLPCQDIIQQVDPHSKSLHWNIWYFCVNKNKRKLDHTTSGNTK